MRRAIPLHLTEKTLLWLRRTEETHHSSIASTGLRKGRASTLTMGTWMTLLGYTEVYTDEVLQVLAANLLPRLPLGPRSIIEREVSKAQSTWPARREAFKVLFEISVGEFKSGNSMDGAIWVRNSIAHGSGRMTSMQKLTEIGRAAHVDVTVIDGELRFGPECIAKCLRTCTQFVSELDLAATAHLLAHRAPSN